MSDRLIAWRRRAGWLAVTALLLAGNVAFFFWYRGSGEKRQEALESRRTALTAEVVSAERESQKLAQQGRRLSKVSQAIDEFYGKRVGSQRATQAATVDEIHSILKKAGVAPAQIAYSIEALARLPLSQMTAGFSFAADYRKFKRLLELFETGPRWIVVKETSLSRNGDVPGSVQARMVVATYFAEERPAAPEAPGRRSGPAPVSRRRS